MKKLALSTLIFFSALILNAQVSTLPNSIGIGQSTDPLVPLHIKKDGEVSRLQGTNPYISFYNGLNWNGYLQAFGNIFAIGTKNNFNLDLYTADLARFTIDGTTGQSTAHQRFNAVSGINLIGPLRVAGNNVGTPGDVLMSLGNGTPAWATVSFNPQVGCQVTFPSVFTIPHSTDTFLLGFTEYYDTSNNMNQLTGEFTVPSSGVYHFEGKLSLAKLNNVDPDIANGIMVIDIVVNNSDRDRIVLDFRTLVQSSAPHRLYQNTLNLNANDVVKFRVRQMNEHTNSIILTANGSLNDTRFTIYKIY
jgi:hypothetical protein